MNAPTTVVTTSGPVETEHEEQAEAPVEEPVVEEILVEEISIDGMCGVY